MSASSSSDSGALTDLSATSGIESLLRKNPAFVHRHHPDGDAAFIDRLLTADAGRRSPQDRAVTSGLKLDAGPRHALENFFADDGRVLSDAAAEQDRVG